jgi:hypothetical protein
MNRERKKKEINQNKVNMMVLDILEDIIEKSTVYDFELGQKTIDLNTYLYFGKTAEQMVKEGVEYACCDTAHKKGYKCPIHQKAKRRC